MNKKQSLKKLINNIFIAIVLIHLHFMFLNYANGNPVMSILHIPIGIYFIIIWYFTKLCYMSLIDTHIIEKEIISETCNQS